MRTQTSLFAVALVGASALACGRTEALWWAGIYASDTGTEDQGDGDGDPSTTTDTDETFTTSTTTPGDGDGDWGSSDTTDTDPTDTDPTDTDPTDTDTDPTDTSTTDTSTTDTSTETTDGTSSETTGCEIVPVAVSPTLASAVFVLDQGAHMSLGFGGPSRWEAIGEALLSQNAGVVWAWEDIHRLGLVSFTSHNGNQGGQCPIVEVVDPDLQTGAAMQMSWAGLNPDDDNPAAEAIELAAGLFGGQPGNLILVLGRNPDTCTNANNQQQGGLAAINATQAAFAAGVRTYLVEVGNLNQNLAQGLANIGLGLDPQGQVDAPWWQPQDTAGLTQDLDAVLAGLVSCTLEVDPAVLMDGEEFCELSLDDTPIALADPDGWTVLAPNSLELVGGACQAYRDGASPALLCSCEAF